MREIKFRIWDKKLKEMNYQSLEDLCEDDYWYDGETDVWSVLHDCNSKQKRFVIGQYTGLKDKNGKEIYEGDILIDDEDEIAIVRYSEADAMFEIIVDNIVTNFSNESSEWWRIIGNIHDNPDLLKESESD